MRMFCIFGDSSCDVNINIFGITLNENCSHEQIFALGGRYFKLQINASIETPACSYIVIVYGA